MDPTGRRRSTAARRLAMASVAVIALTLPASAVVSGAATPPSLAAGEQAGSGQVADQLAVARAGSTLPARGAGAADTTAADPAAAGAPGAASLAAGSRSVPPAVLAAYRKAAAALAIADPSCHLAWPLLAGIGKVETDHGRSWGAASRITATGEVVPTILGPVLDGRHGTATLLDTDGGAYDRDRHYDRAVGPMQFVPATWRELGRDGNGDGVKDPNNIWDAALAAAGYLCGGGRDLADPADRRAAILAYNPSSAYVRAVLAWANAYQKAGLNLPALEGVPNPLVLGAGGSAGDGPFGDSVTYDDPGAGFGSDPTSGGGGSLGSGAGSGQSDGGISAGERPAGFPSRLVPSVQPVPHPTHQPTPNSGPSRKPAQKPTDKPTSIPTPTPTPTPTPAPGIPTPTPTPPVCVDTGVAAVPTVAATATPVDSNRDGKNDALHVTAAVTAPKAGAYTIGVRLLDANGWRVTSTVATVTLAAGRQDLAADLPGPDIGDAGASGPATMRITVRAAGAPVTCAIPLLAAASAGTLDASTFDGWATTVDRLRERLAADVTSGVVSGVAATELPLALQTPSAQAPDLSAFRPKLATTPVVSRQEQARLDSLAGRLIAQAAGPAQRPAGGPWPFTDDVYPAADGVG